MNSFTLTAVGNLARNPEAVAKGDVTYTRFCLVGNDYAGKDDRGAPREIVTSLWFVAFGPLGEALVRNVRKGDQLVVEAQVRANNWTDKQGEKQYDHDFIVQGFRFGAPGKAKRDELNGKLEPGGKSEAESKPGADAKSRDAQQPAEGDAGASAPGSSAASTSAAGTTANSKGAATSADKPGAQRAGRRATAAPP